MSTVTGLAVLLLASLSPLLTGATLWQKKEWRIDRAQEHLRANGWFRQLFGIIRPVVVLGGFFIVSAETLLTLLAALSIVQIVLRKQKYPVWTGKAVILVCGSLIATSIIGYWSLTPLLPLLQPAILFVTWLLFLPIDTLMKERLMKKAAALRNTFTDITVIGITGSVGKTTTKELLAHILSTTKNVLCTPAYVNSEMGVAKWLLAELPKQNRNDPLMLIVEMGAYRKGEIARLCRIAGPQIGIVTYIGTQHIALFGSQEALKNAKGELPSSLPKDGLALLNADNPLCAELKDNTAASVITVGTGGHADLEVFDIEETPEGIRFRTGDTLFRSTLRGTHNVTNALLAIGAARRVGMTDAAIANAFRSFTPLSNTFSVQTERGITVLNDTHNASPESFRAAVQWAKTQPAAHRVLLTPGLIELGTEEDRIHHELGEACRQIDTVIFTGTAGRSAFELGYGKPVLHTVPTETPIQKDDLLLCIGRSSSQTIAKLLP